MESQDLSKRITELELGYMALERLVEDLSGVVAEQQKTIAALAADLVMLSAKASSLDGGAEAPAPHDERPPHY